MENILSKPVLGENCLTPRNNNSTYKQYFIDLLNTHDIKQYNGKAKCLGRILDLVLMNDIMKVGNCEESLVNLYIL